MTTAPLPSMPRVPADAPVLATVPRPARPLGPIAFLRAVTRNTLSVCDEEVFRELVVVRRYGPFRVAFVSDPEALRQVLIERPDDFPRLRTIRRLFATDLGTGTLASDGPVWRDRRRIAAAVVDPRAIAPDLATLAETAEAEAEAWGAQYGDGPFDVDKAASELMTAVLNKEITGGDPRGVTVLRWLSKVPRKPRFFDVAPIPERLRPLVSVAKLSPERAGWRDMVTTMLADRRAVDWPGGRDMMWRAAQLRDRTTGQPLPMMDIRDEVLSLTAAGDAVVRALGWIWYLLARHPDVEHRMHAELDAARAAGDIGTDWVTRLPYMKRVLDESMRLYPPIPAMVREVRRPCELGGHHLKRGTFLFCMPWVLHRHERLWDDPERFDPDRFLPERREGRHRLAYLPFSTGMRICSGSSLATAVLMAALAALAARYRFRLDETREVRMFGAITLLPEGGLWVRLERR